MNKRYQFLRFPEGKVKAATFSYDDGVLQDVRLAELFSSHGLKATFNINSLMTGECGDASRLTFDGIKQHIVDRGHEVAVHGANHRAPTKQRTVDGIYDVLTCRLTLEEKLGGIIRGMAYPDTGIRMRTSGSSNVAKVKEYLADLDIAYARTLGGDNNRFELPEDWYEWMPTAHHNNEKIFEYIDEFVDIDESKLYYASKTPRLFYTWGHSYEFDRDGNWDRIEKICEKLGGRDDIWYATNIEIYDYVKAYESLRYSADGLTVYNPTLITVWIWCDFKLCEIKPGHTVRIFE